MYTREVITNNDKRGNSQEYDSLCIDKPKRKNASEKLVRRAHDDGGISFVWFKKNDFLSNRYVQMYTCVITMILLASREINDRILLFCPRITIGYIDWDSDEILILILQREYVSLTRVYNYIKLFKMNQ